MLDKLQNINSFLLNYLNSFSHNYIIEKIVFVFADSPIFFIPIFLIFYWIYYNYNSKYKKEEKIQKKSDLLIIFYGVIFAISISLIIQQVIQIDRPEQHITNSGKLLLKHIPDASFPSDHATVSFAFLTGLFLAGYKKLGIILFFLFLIMNISRIIAGVHWPFDILAGIFVGIFGSIISFKILKKNKFVKYINLWIIKLASYFKL